MGWFWVFLVFGLRDWVRCLALASIPCLAHGIGLDVRHGCASVPCLACVIGLDVRNGSGEHSVFGLRDGAGC